MRYLLLECSRYPLFDCPIQVQFHVYTFLLLIIFAYTCSYNIHVAKMMKINLMFGVYFFTLLSVCSLIMINH